MPTTGMQFLAESKRHTDNLDRTRINADIPNVLDRLGINWKTKGDELHALCPNPGHDDQHVGTWSICDCKGDKRNGLMHCFACVWSGSIFDLVSTVVDCSFQEAVKFVTGSSTLEEVDPFAEADFSEYLRPLRKWIPQEIESPPVQEIIPGSVCQRYLAGRGVTSTEIEKWGLKDWRQRARVFVPLTRNHELISWLARSYVDAETKVLYPKGAPQRWAMFGIDEVNRGDRRLTICEGWLDAIRLNQAGMVNPVGVGTNRLTVEKARELSWASDIVVWMDGKKRDGDESGELLAKNVVEWLGSGRTIRVVEMPEGTDPADHTPDELRTFNMVAYSDHRTRRT